MSLGAPTRDYIPTHDAIVDQMSTLLGYTTLSLPYLESWAGQTTQIPERPLRKGCRDTKNNTNVRENLKEVDMSLSAPTRDYIPMHDAIVHQMSV